MKELVEPFDGNHQDDAAKWLEGIVHFFDIIRLPGVKENFCSLLVCQSDDFHHTQLLAYIHEQL